MRRTIVKRIYVECVHKQTGGAVPRWMAHDDGQPAGVSPGHSPPSLRCLTQSRWRAHRVARTQTRGSAGCLEGQGWRNQQLWRWPGLENPKQWLGVQRPGLSPWECQPTRATRPALRSRTQRIGHCQGRCETMLAIPRWSVQSTRR